MPQQRPPEPGPGDDPRGVPGGRRPAHPFPSGRPVAPDAPRVPVQRRSAPSRPPQGAPPGVPTARSPRAVQRPTRVVPGPDPGSVVLVGSGDPTLTALPAGETGLYPDPSRIDDLAAEVREAVDQPGGPGYVATSPGAGPARAPGKRASFFIVDSSLLV